MLTRIRMRIAAVAAALAFPAVAAAGPITAGVSVGAHHDKVDSDGEGNRTLGLYGRVGLARRLSAQLEVMKIDTDEATYTPTTIRTATASLRLDLVDQAKSRFIPTVSFGMGIDRASTDYDTTEGHHFEGGLGIEYRAQGGLVVGLDFRLGGRSVEDEAVAYPTGGIEGVAPLVYDGGGLREGEYRAIRLSAGIAF